MKKPFVIKDVLEKRNLILGNEGFQLSNTLNILDVGCGGGILAEPLARAGSNLVGIDVNHVSIEAAKDHAKLDPCLKISYRWESIEDHSLHNVEKYDIVILNSVLPHAKNHDVLLRDCIKTLKPGGIIFASGVAKTFEGWFRVIFMGEIIFKYVSRGAFNWSDLINSSDVEKILNENYCSLEGIKGIYYDIFTSSCKWINSTNGFYILHAAKE